MPSGSGIPEEDDHRGKRYNLLKNNFTKKTNSFLGYKAHRMSAQGAETLNQADKKGMHFYGKAGRFGYMT